MVDILRQVAIDIMVIFNISIVHDPQLLALLPPMAFLLLLHPFLLRRLFIIILRRLFLLALSFEMLHILPNISGMLLILNVRSSLAESKMQIEALAQRYGALLEQMNMEVVEQEVDEGRVAVLHMGIVEMNVNLMMRSTLVLSFSIFFGLIVIVLVLLTARIRGRLRSHIVHLVDHGGCRPIMLRSILAPRRLLQSVLIQWELKVIGRNIIILVGRHRSLDQHAIAEVRHLLAVENPGHLRGLLIGEHFMVLTFGVLINLYMRFLVVYGFFSFLALIF